MKFATGTIYSNDVCGLKRLMPTIQDFDYNIMIDGNWKDFNKPKLSDDGSREVIQSYTKTIQIYMPDSMPRDKYDRLLRECEKLEIDYLVVIDSDEYVKQPFDYEKFKEECISKEKNFKAQTFRVIMEYFDGTWQSHRPNYRVIYNPGICHYGERHNQLWCEDRELFSKYSGDIDSFVFIHDKRYKTQEYIKSRFDWNTNHPQH